MSRPVLPFFTLVVVFLVTIDQASLSYGTRAVLPSFSRQEITDEVNDWFVPDTSPVTNISKCVDIDTNLNKTKFPAPDIKAVSYFSNGESFKAAVWLSDIFSKTPQPTNSSLIKLNNSSYYFHGVRYSMSVVSEGVYDQGLDYIISIGWLKDKYNNWTETIFEQSPSPPGNRILVERPNFKGFYIESGNYVLLSFDLKDINYPRQYRVLFSINAFFDRNNVNCQIADATNWVPVPPPEFQISTAPSSMTLRPGEERDISIYLNSSTSSRAVASLSTDPIEGIEIQFTPDEISLPANGVTTSNMHVKVSQDLNSRPYTLPIFAEISLPTTLRSSGGSLYRNTVAETIDESSYLTLAVLPPLTLEQHLGNFVNSWITPLGALWTFLVAVAAVIAPLLVRMYNRRKKIFY
jgi:hypothetical protein